MSDSRSAPHVAQLKAIFSESVDNLRGALSRYINGGTLPDAQARKDGAFAYPELRIRYHGDPAKSPTGRAFGRLTTPGLYAQSVTRPELFEDYLTEQIDFLLGNYDVEIEVGRSRQEIPYPYVIGDIELGDVASADLSRYFPATELAQIGDEIADGAWWSSAGAAQPLALFDALRVDFSLARLRHYSGTEPEHFQRYMLFTNYHRYVDAFVRWALEQVKDPASPYTALAGAGGLLVTGGDDVDPERVIADGMWRRHQMPAYHLISDGGNGITLVNIGVGPSNAKTITDHLAVLRPEAWLMIGHCGGLRESQRIGDYVLAHAYLRDDHVLDAVLSPTVPIPPIAEVQQALQEAALQVSGEDDVALRQRLRTGTVVTTDDRNWELRYSSSALLFNQSRAVAIDMESATIAAQGYRFRVPYGTLLCISDKPLHGEIKLPGQANRFYERAIGEHLMIGIAACERMRANSWRLHSRKLRAFNEPPFR
nr:AMP nucleosidase [uncultured Sphingosinicella sp.]